MKAKCNCLNKKNTIIKPIFNIQDNCVSKKEAMELKDRIDKLEKKICELENIICKKVQKTQNNNNKETLYKKPIQNKKNTYIFSSNNLK